MRSSQLEGQEAQPNTKPGLEVSVLTETTVSPRFSLRVHPANSAFRAQQAFYGLISDGLRLFNRWPYACASLLRAAVTCASHNQADASRPFSYFEIEPLTLPFSVAR